MAQVTKSQIAVALKERMRELARLGGLARAQALSPERRVAIAKKGGQHSAVSRIRRAQKETTK
jgi:general stress protein YciG